MLKHIATDYPVEGADKPPTIHKQQRIHRITAMSLSKDNNNGNDNRTAMRLITITVAISNGYIVRQRAPNRPHQHKTTGVNRQRLRAGRAPHHGYTPILIATSADNGRAYIAPDNNGPKTPTKGRTNIKNDDMIPTTTRIKKRVEYISPDATLRHLVAYTLVSLLRHHYHHHRHIIIIFPTTFSHFRH